MTPNRCWMIGATALAAAVAVAGCSATASQQSSSASTPASATTTTAAAAEAHNQADVMFAHHMIPHHQQAIEMSDMLLTKQGIDPRVIELANQIKAAQGPEITTMQGWLTQWGEPAMPMTPDMSEMPGHTGMPGMPNMDMPGMPGMGTPPTQTPTPTTTPMPGMPDMGAPGSTMPGMPGMGMSGMMSPEDMTALQNAQGVAASKLFLTQMIEHHNGAITMAQTEVDTGQYPAATALAKAIIDTQKQEIATMQTILGTL